MRGQVGGGFCNAGVGGETLVKHVGSCNHSDELWYLTPIPTSGAFGVPK